MTQTFIARAIDVKDFTFSHIGVQEGVGNQRVYSLSQTTDGAIWWTTKLGVDRTNGAKVDNYHLGDRKTFDSYAGMTIRFASYSDITLQDSLFVFDNKGRLYRYDKTQNHFSLRYDITRYLGSDIVVEDIFITKSKVFFAMREGLYMISRMSGKPVPVHKNLYCNAIIPLKDKNGNLLKGNVLIATNKGLMMTTLTKSDAMSKPHFISGAYVCSAYYDIMTAKLWIGTLDSGVKVTKWGSNQWTDIPGVPHNPVRSIAPYNTRTMLIGIDGFGVYQCQRQTLQASSLLFDANNGRNGVLHGNGVYDILVGKYNNIVIGTYSGGIDMACPVGSTTAIFKHVSGSTQCINNDHVNCVAQTDANHLLMGTDNGLNIFDSSTSTWSNMAQGMVVLDICKRSGGGFLLATYGNGVCEIGADGKAHTVYGKANGTLQDDHVYSLLYDKRGNLWIGSLFGKLAELPPTGSKLYGGGQGEKLSGIRYYDIDNVLSLAELPDGRIAVGSAHGLFIANPTTGKVHELKYSVPGCSRVNKYVQNLYVSVPSASAKRSSPAGSGNSSGHSPCTLWIATDGGGVYVYNLKTKACSQITTDNGLPSNSVSSITKDRSGRIWFGTERGLAFTYPSTGGNSDAPKIIDVNYGNGICTEYSRGAACNLLNGHMLLGTIEGARIIDPQRLQKTSPFARPKDALPSAQETGGMWGLSLLRIITEESDSSKVFAFNEKVEKMLAKGVVTLSYSQRSFELYFECINILDNFDIAYQYKIGDGEWSEPNSNQFIRFVNLEPGRHILYIRCVSRTGGAVFDTKKLEIIIFQPWWNSWWMWCIYIAILALAFYGAWRVYDLQTRYKRLIMERVNKVSTATESSAVSNATNDYGRQEPSAASVAVEGMSDDVSSDTSDSQGESEEFVNKATKIVLDNISDTDFTIDTLCREIAMSRTLFYLKVKSFTGKSPQDFVRMIRLEKAGSLLRNGRSVTDVATLTGFDNPKYFSVVFKKYFGVSPSKY